MQHANFGGRDRHRIAAKPATPFLAVDDKTRGVNRVAAPSRGVTLLSRSEFRFGEAIAPAEMVPVINVKGDGNDLLPQVLTRFECTHPFFGRRTTATPFRSEEFDERVLRLAALKCLRLRGKDIASGKPDYDHGSRDNASPNFAHPSADRGHHFLVGAPRAHSLQQMIADAQRIGNDGECRIYRAGGAEKAAIHDVKIVELVRFAIAIQRARLRVVTKPDAAVLMRNASE